LTILLGGQQIKNIYLIVVGGIRQLLIFTKNIYMKKITYRKLLRSTVDFYETLEVFSDGTMEFAVYYIKTDK